MRVVQLCLVQDCGIIDSLFVFKVVQLVERSVAPLVLLLLFSLLLPSLWLL